MIDSATRLLDVAPALEEQRHTMRPCTIKGLRFLYSDPRLGHDGGRPSI